MDFLSFGCQWSMALSLESYTGKHMKPNVAILTKYNNVVCVFLIVFSPHGSWCQDKRSYTWGMFPHCKYKHLNQTSASKFFYMRCLLVMNFVFLSFISADWKGKSRLFVATFSRLNTPCRLFQTSVLKNPCPGSLELWLLWYILQVLSTEG